MPLNSRGPVTAWRAGVLAVLAAIVFRSSSATPVGAGNDDVVPRQVDGGARTVALPRSVNTGRADTVIESPQPAPMPPNDAATRTQSGYTDAGDVDCDVVVVGGGIAGLSIVDSLATLGIPGVCLFERDARYGGRVLDAFFPETPGVPAAMGARRFDAVDHTSIIALSERFNLTTVPYSRTGQKFRARGTTSRELTPIVNMFNDLPSPPDAGAYPGGCWAFVEETFYGDMVCPFSIDASICDAYPSLGSCILGLFGAEAHACLQAQNAFPSDFEVTSPNDAATYLYWLAVELCDSFDMRSPEGGMSMFTNGLMLSAMASSVPPHMYMEEPVLDISRVIDTLGGPVSYHVQTSKRTVMARHVMLAAPPDGIRTIKGDVVADILRVPEFQSIIAIPASKIAAAYPASPQPWFYPVDGVCPQPSSSVDGLCAFEEYISRSTCLGQMYSPIRETSAATDYVVAYVNYVDGECALHWRDAFAMFEKSSDEEGLKAYVNEQLARLFPDTTAPMPTNFAYKFWEGAWHFQMQGDGFSLDDILDWSTGCPTGNAVDDVDGSGESGKVIICGEAVDPYRGWTEGAVRSAAKCVEAFEARYTPPPPEPEPEPEQFYT